MSKVNTLRAVTVIPPSIGRLSTVLNPTTQKKRVAAYARVSTDNEEQLSSYEAQVDHYTRLIQANDQWLFIAVYSDEGISATNTKKRDGFNRMISDALAGRIDMIITKSVSRFARNTVDSLITVRQLKEKGVEVYFEKENIYTLDSKGELLITIMSSLAQEESRSISENVTWGQRKRFADGKVSMPYKQFLGYEKGEDGLPKVVEEEAEVVRLIYRLFLEGKAPSYIAKYLTDCGIPTPANKVKWQSSTVESILTNEKYMGDAVLQKSYTIDFLTKKTKVNEGEVPQYYVENSHTGIVTHEIFDLAQHEMKKRTARQSYMTGTSCFSSKIICGECGSLYGSKVWHSTSKYRRTVWQCNNKFKNVEKCRTPHLYEDQIKQAFVGAFNSMIKNKNEIIEDYKAIVATLMDTTALDDENELLQAECGAILGLMQKAVDENAHTAIDQADYVKRHTGLTERYNAVKSKITANDDKVREHMAKRGFILEFLKLLRQSDSLLTEFDEGVWSVIIELVTVRSDIGLVFRFKYGDEIIVSIR